ncbi:MAG: ornithine carbamoyltransferase [bacterium]|nr:ornithine carbamoyltransferase [bacterium]
MTKRDLRTVIDLNRDELLTVFQLAAEMKENPLQFSKALEGKTMAMINEKQSLRTKVTFEAGIQQLGGYAVYLTNQDINLGKREPVKDIARNLSRWVDLVAARVYKQATVMELAKYSSIPVINALSDEGHPCQAMADLFTIWDFVKKREELRGFNLTFIGDGNNVCNSLILIAGLLGFHLTVCTPAGYEPNPTMTWQGREMSHDWGGAITFELDPVKAVAGADAIYTDVWTSMGQEEETEKRREVFKPYQVNEALLEKAPKHAVVMHCLPAHRGEEITDGVMESERSVVFEQAENRLHTQKALMKFLVDASN